MVVYNDLKHLTDDTARAVGEFVARLKNHGLTVKVGETYRTPERQEWLYRESQRLIAAGKSPLTKTLHSWHTTGRAADIDIAPATMEHIEFYIDTARELGFRTMVSPVKIEGDIEAGVQVPPYWDWHHLEYRGGREFADAFREYDELRRAPVATAGLSGLLSIGAIFSAVHSFLSGGRA